MTTDYFEAKKTGGSKDSIEITVDVKCDKAIDFANEIRDFTINRVLEIIDDMCRDEETGYVISRKMVYVLASELRDRVMTLKGGDQE